MSKAGLASLLAFLASCGGGEKDALPERPLNLVLISIDTLRADRLGCYGYGRDTTPAIDRFAAGAVRFENVFAECSWTIPSHFTMLSGLYPSSHGVVRPEQRPSDDLRLLSQYLADAGYYTFALTDGGWLSPRQGFGRGFATFQAQGRTIFDPRRSGMHKTVADAETFIRFRRDKGPFFAFLHTYDVHCPYDPPEPYRSMFVTEGREEIEADGKCGATDFNRRELSAAQAAYLSDRYDGGVRWVDDALAELFRFLDEEGLRDDTIVVLTSDHGEELLEHGSIGHERTLYWEALHIPLIVRVPGWKPREVDTPVGLVDLVPTLLELMRVSAAQTFDGRSLVGLLRGEAPVGFPAYRPSELDWLEDLDSLIGNDAQLIVNRTTGRTVYFDRTRDPLEQVDASAGEPERARRMRSMLDAVLARLGRRGQTAEQRRALDPGELEELKRLGYVDEE